MRFATPTHGLMYTRADGSRYIQGTFNDAFMAELNAELGRALGWDVQAVSLAL
jgi:hypothetical protein